LEVFLKQIGANALEVVAHQIFQFASSEESVGESDRQRCLSMKNFRNFRQVESKDLC
jgi:hypothetical protein